jgi:AraC-like DNA-binding protein
MKQEAEPEVVINPPWGKLNSVNAILNGRNTTHSAQDYRGTLSIKCVLQGDALYEAEGCRFAVDATGYLVLNCGQTYTLTISSDIRVETFCLFFRPGFAEKTLHTLITPTELLLDDPLHPGGQPVQFFERMYPHDAIVTPVVLGLHNGVRYGGVTAGWYEERFYLLLDRLLCLHRGLRPEIECLPAVRAGTRVELYRRLHRARDYMDASLDEALTLERIAAVAWLSPHHFLRLFKQVFAVTPHQYRTHKRIERARRLLISTDRPITEIALESGMESHSSFSRLFRSHVGVSPESYRQQNQVPHRK